MLACKEFSVIFLRAPSYAYIHLRRSWHSAFQSNCYNSHAYQKCQRVDQHHCHLLISPHFNSPPPPFFFCLVGLYGVLSCGLSFPFNRNRFHFFWSPCSQPNVASSSSFIRWLEARSPWELWKLLPYKGKLGAVPDSSWIHWAFLCAEGEDATPQSQDSLWVFWMQRALPIDSTNKKISDIDSVFLLSDVQQTCLLC